MVGLDDIPVEAWRCLGETAVEFFTRLFNTILESERMGGRMRMLMEKYREGQKELHCVFVALEKAYDRVLTE